MIATRGATDAFSGVQRHVNSSLKRVGAKNIEAGIGCGVGFGHGFGVGLAVKPRLLLQIQSQFLKLASHVVKKLGLYTSSTLPVNQGILSASSQTGKSMGNEPSPEYHTGVLSKFVNSGPNITFNGNIRDGTTLGTSVETLAPESAVVTTEYKSQTEEVLNNFLKNPLFKEEGSLPYGNAGAKQLENNVLQMVLKHQLLIEELMQHNEKLHQILVEELKIQPKKLNSTKFTCTECFECRRKLRRR